jgi:diacylglycerol kinase family enzyme
MSSPPTLAPGTLPGIAASVPSIPATNVEFCNSEVTWTSADGPQTLHADNIIFILDGSQTDEKNYIICSLKEDEEQSESPYQLSFFVASHLPPTLLQSHLLDKLPNYLRNHSTASRLDVIVSTKSGTGLALKCWEAVLQPLLQLALHLHAPDTAGLSDSSSEGPAHGPAVSNQVPAYNVLITQHSQSVRRFAQKHWSQRQSTLSHAIEGLDGSLSHTIILLSGDGGVVDLLNGVSEFPALPSQPVIALLPLGTGNAMFHSLHKPLYRTSSASSLILGLRTLFRGQAAPLPTFEATFSPRSRLISYSDETATDADSGISIPADPNDTSINRLIGAIVASYGFHASIVWESDTPEYRKHGDKRFGMVAQELLKESHAYNATVKVTSPQTAADAAEAGSSSPKSHALPHGRVGYVLATMVSNLEKHFTISPASRPLAPHLRLVHFGAVGGEKTMEIMMQAYKEGSHVGMEWLNKDTNVQERVGYEEVESMRVTILEEDARWRKVCIDGTIVEIEQGGWMDLRKMDTLPFRILADPSVVGENLD